MPSWVTRWLGSERGDGPVETAILIPLVLVLLFGAVQAGLYYHDHNTASTAAQTGAIAARGEEPDSGAAAARAYLDQVASSTSASVAESRGGGTATVTVTVNPTSIVPLFSLPTIRATASMPVERVTS